MRSEAPSRDERYWQAVTELCAARGYALRDVLQQFPAYVMRREAARFISHYELFKHVVDLPGCVVDLGVYRGGSLFTWSTLMDMFCPYDRARRVFGFDSFEGLQNFDQRDGTLEERTGKISGGYRSSREEIEQLTALHNEASPLHLMDNRMPNERVEIIEGDVLETIPAFIAAHPGFRIALLNLDVDLYEPTKVALEHFYPLVVKGGVVCFDEYGVMPWEGEATAVDEYFAARAERPVIRKHPFTQQPSGYFLK